MKNIINNSKYFAFAILLTLGFSACVDLEFDQPIASGICSSDAVVNLTIAELKDMHVLGTTMDITDTIIISGIVVGDDASGNFYKKLIVQDETAGIEVYFGATDLANSFPRGTEVFIKCTGLTLSDYNGVTQVGTIEQAVIGDFVCKGSTGLTVEPKQVSIGDLTADDISTLVQLNNVQFNDNSASSTYADPVNLQSLNLTIESCDDDSEIVLRTSGYSDFAGLDTPNGSGSINAIYSVFGSTQQLFINNTDDVNFTGERCGGPTTVASLNEDFQDNAANNEDINIEGWKLEVVKGDRKWRGKEFSDNVYAQATAYGDASEEMDTWMILPGVDVSNQMVLSFDSQVGFPVSGHDGLKVYVSTDYTGFNFLEATWVELEGNIANSTWDSFEWENSGNILLPVEAGKTGYVAFQYTGSGADNGNGDTSTYGIDNVVIEAQ